MKVLQLLVVVALTCLYSGYAQADCTTTATSTQYQYQYVWPQIPTGVTSFTFRVKASNDAFIGLSPTNADANDMYEIVIGGWSNQKSSIRLCKQCSQNSLTDTPNILDSGEYRKFRISFENDFVQVSQDDSAPFMSFQNPNTFNVQYVGISTGWGSTGSFEFCGFEIALSGWTGQSSTLDETDGHSYKAVDGNTDGNWGSGHSCSHTNWESEAAWWMTDTYPGHACLGDVVIYNRIDCCKERLVGAVVRWGNNYPDYTQNTVCGTITQQEVDDTYFQGGFITKNCGNVGQGRFLSISKDGYNSIMTLCEVKAYTC